MKTAIPSVLAHSKPLALLLSIGATSAWLGAVTTSFALASQVQPRQIYLPTVTVVAKAASQQAQPRQIELPAVTVVAKAAPLMAKASSVSVRLAAAAAGSKL